MAKRELIDRKKLIRDVKESNAIDFAERMKFSNVVEHQKPITEEEIVKPYLEKLKTEIAGLKRFELRGAVTPLVNVNRVIELIDNLLTEKGTEE